MITEFLGEIFSITLTPLKESWGTLTFPKNEGEGRWVPRTYEIEPMDIMKFYHGRGSGCKSESTGGGRIWSYI